MRLKDPIKEKDWLKTSSQKRSIGPICLPERDTRDKMVTAFIIGFGTQWQRSCHTGGNGWQMYTPCAPGATWQDDQGKKKEMKVWEWNNGGKKIVQCSQSYPPMDVACMEFNMAGNFKEEVTVSSSIDCTMICQVFAIKKQKNIGMLSLIWLEIHFKHKA